ncbi:hypothetical protein PInf_011269 [Phytophthora infestans]|nr:hypothetical protein PInf_011269 [Phytophthora infestans]
MDCREEDDLRTRHTVSLIQLFLRFNANVDKQCQRGKTALHHATTDDAYEVARLLLSSGASVDAQDGKEAYLNGKEAILNQEPHPKLQRRLST